MVACCSAGGTECSSAYMGHFEGGGHYPHYLHHSLERKKDALSHVQLLQSHELYVGCQFPMLIGFSRQEYWSGCHSLHQRIFPT